MVLLVARVWPLASTGSCLSKGCVHVMTSGRPSLVHQHQGSAPFLLSRAPGERQDEPMHVEN